MIYAGFFRRFAATIIDTLIVIIPSLFIGGSVAVIPLSFGLGLIIGLLYKPVFESSVMAATPGKALMGIVVQGEDGQTLTYKKAVIRYLCSYLSSVIMGIGYLIQPFTSKRQALHDMLSEAVVIRKETPDLNYFIVWKEQLKNIFSKL